MRLVAAEIGGSKEQTVNKETEVKGRRKEVCLLLPLESVIHIE